MATPQELIELEQKYGKKAASLIQLGKLDLLIPGGLNVPTVHPLAHKMILWLFASCGLNIEKRWREILAKCPPGKDLDRYILEQAENGAIAELREQIIAKSQDRHFVTALQHVTYNNITLIDFIKDTAAKHPGIHPEDVNMLMVRSSGDEDQSDISNPGGNESHPAVGSINSVAAQVGLVLASYFKPKSFDQRKIEDKPDSLSKLPQCSVLLQEMVGEEAVADPSAATTATTVAGVVFTRRPDGYTDDLFLINAAYGHGEGVVQGSVPSDLYVVSGKQLHIDRFIADKIERVAPIVDRGLEHVPVSHAQAHKATLTPTQVRKLNYICEQISDAYGGVPLDIEWVFKDGKFYIVQVRELPKPRISLSAQYVSEPDLTKVLLTGQAVVPGCDVRVIESPEQCIIKDKLSDALKYFLANREQRQHVKAIFVKEGLQTSHEANYFRYLGIPVYIVKDSTPIKQALKKHQPITLCCQSGRIFAGKDHTATDGWFKHPYKLPLTLGPAPVTEKVAAAMEPEVAEIKDLNITWSHLMEEIETIRDGDDIAACLAATKKVRDIISMLATRLSEKIKDRSLRRELAIVLQHAWIACDALSQTLADGDLAVLIPEQYKLQKLFALQRIETILSQIPGGDNINQLSLQQILQEYIEQARIIQKIDGLRASYTEAQFRTTLDPEIYELLIQAFKATKLCLSEEFRDRYSRFLLILAYYHPAKFSEYCGILHDYTRDGILGVALNLMPSIPANIDSAQVLAIFDSEWTQHFDLYSSSLVEKLSHARSLSKKWRAKIEDWADPNKFAKMFEEFQDFIGLYQELITWLVQAEDKLQKQLLINLLSDMLDIYDLSLKELSSSIIYSNETMQGQNFSLLLSPYCDLSSKLLLSLAGKSHLKKMTATGHYDNIIDYETYVYKIIGSIFKDAKAASYAQQLTPSPDFNVSLAVFTTNSNPERTLKDMDTLIDVFTYVHQNAIAALSLHQKEGLVFARLPEALQKLIDEFIIKIKIESHYAKATPEFMSWSFDPPKVRLTFNCPCRSHSANIILSYNIDEPEHVQIGLHLFMDNESNRCVNTRVLARNKQNLDPNYPVQFLGYNAIESSDREYTVGTFFVNSFEWQANLADCTTVELTKLAADINDLFKCSFDVVYEDVTGTQLPQLYLPELYVPGMFAQSFAGLSGVCRFLLDEKSTDAQFYVAKGVLTAILERLENGPIAELDILHYDFSDFFKLLLEVHANNPSELAAVINELAPEIIARIPNIPDFPLALALAKCIHRIHLDPKIPNIFQIILEWGCKHPTGMDFEAMVYNVKLDPVLFDLFTSNKMIATTLSQARTYALICFELGKKHLTKTSFIYARAFALLIAHQAEWTAEDYTLANKILLEYAQYMSNPITRKEPAIPTPNELYAKLNFTTSSITKETLPSEHKFYEQTQLKQFDENLVILLQLCEITKDRDLLSKIWNDVLDNMLQNKRIADKTVVNDDEIFCIESLKVFLNENPKHNAALVKKIVDIITQYEPLTKESPELIVGLANLIIDNLLRQRQRHLAISLIISLYAIDPSPSVNRYKPVLASISDEEYVILYNKHKHEPTKIMFLLHNAFSFKQISALEKMREAGADLNMGIEANNSILMLALDSMEKDGGELLFLLLDKVDFIFDPQFCPNIDICTACIFSQKPEVLFKLLTKYPHRFKDLDINVKEILQNLDQFGADPSLYDHSVIILANAYLAHRGDKGFEDQIAEQILNFIHVLADKDMRITSSSPDELVRIKVALIKAKPDLDRVELDRVLISDKTIGSEPTSPR